VNRIVEVALLDNVRRLAREDRAVKIGVGCETAGGLNKGTNCVGGQDTVGAGVDELALEPHESSLLVDEYVEPLRRDLEANVCLPQMLVNA
jgi:hypothetical protein